MIRFGWPAAWLLAIPAALLLWRLARGWGRATAAIRVAAVGLLLAALAGVQFRLGGAGVDLVALVDRSASMTESDRRECNEWIAALGRDRRPGDRLAVVTFGRFARLQQRLAEGGDYPGDSAEVSPDGSDLAGGLEMALALLDRDRPGRVLVLSDGQATGGAGAELPAARRAAAAGVPVDYRLFEHPAAGDIAVGSLLLPAKVDQNEPFQFSAMVYSDHPADVNYTLTRPGLGGEPIRGRRHVAVGANRWVFRDAVAGRGVVDYQLNIEPTATPGETWADKPDNNSARGVVHVKAPPALLVVNSTGQPDNLVRALLAGKLNVDLAAAKTAGLSLEKLAGYRAVILANVSAGDIGPAGLRAVRTFVTDMGGGLMVTGGQRSFGSGGYYLSELDNAKDPVLPVSMELRKEHRKLSLALGIVMDRSGSMAMTVPSGQRKMDLANLGAAEAVSLLNDMDSVAVVAVDSLAHVIVPLTGAGARDDIVRRIKKVQSEGGGIFTYTGLLAGGKEIEHASQSTRHLILFADADDAEEPGEYVRLLERFEKLGVTVSVIGLGRETDSTADFLKDVAKRGHGQIFFSNDPHDLPRLFSQDTMTVARDTFIKDPTGVAELLDLKALGEFRGPGGAGPGAAMPQVGAYNLTYLRPGAMMGYRTTDEYAAPVVAFWQRGLGRAMAVTFEADGKFTGPALAAWPAYGDFFVTVGRWLLGQNEPDGVRVTLEHRGSRGVVRMEQDPERGAARDSDRSISPTAHVMFSAAGPGSAGGAQTRRLPLKWISDSVAEAEFDLEQTGTYQAVVNVDGDAGGGPSPDSDRLRFRETVGQRESSQSPAPTARVIRTGAMCLPYSPEFAPRFDLSSPSGREVLAAVAATSGGVARLGAQGVFAPTSQLRRRWVDIRPALLWLTLLLLVAEIAGRRLSLWNAAGFGWLTRSVRLVASRLPRVPLARLLPGLRWFRRRRAAGEPTETTAGPAALATAPDESTAAAPPPPPAPAQPKDKTSAFDRAKRKAKRDYRR